MRENKIIFANVKELSEYLAIQTQGNQDQIIADFVSEKYPNKNEDEKFDKTLSLIRNIENYKTKAKKRNINKNDKANNRR